MDSTKVNPSIRKDETTSRSSGPRAIRRRGVRRPVAGLETEALPMRLLLSIALAGTTFCSAYAEEPSGLVLWAERGQGKNVFTESGEAVPRVSNLEAGGRAYIDETRTTFLSIEKQSDTEWLANAVINQQDSIRLFTVAGSSSWIKLKFTDFEGQILDFGFDSAYSLPPGLSYPYVRDQLHVLQPGSYNTRWFFSSRNDSAEFLITAEAIPPPLFGDVNLDGKVAFDDFLILSANFPRGLSQKWVVRGWTVGDFNQDGLISMRDYLLLADNYGRMKQPVAASVPEPSGISLLAVALLALARIRRRRG